MQSYVLVPSQGTETADEWMRLGLEASTGTRLVEDRMLVFKEQENANVTPDEAWESMPIPGHFYSFAALFALNELGAGNGRSCLVIGSPLFEAVALQGVGWEVSYLDVRVPPMNGRCVVGDAVKIPFASESFDAVSTTCVLCHVGLGRYGDPEVENGDVLALREIHRVMKPEAVAVVMFGPSFLQPVSYRMGTVHRVYGLQDPVGMAVDAGFTPAVIGVWSNGKWLTEPEIASQTMLNERGAKLSAWGSYSYLFMKLEKPREASCNHTC